MQQTPVAAGRRTREPDVAPALRLRFAYDAYLSSAEALHVQQANAWQIATNVGRQEDVFAGWMAASRRDLRTLSESLAAKNGRTAEKEELTGRIAVLETIDTNVTFDDEDKKAVMLFADTASKVVVKNFREMSTDDLNTANKIMDEIIESLKSFDFQSKIDVRNKLKDLLIQVVTLTTKLNQQKLKCEDIFKEEESLRNHNSSLKILKAQYEEDLNASLFPKKIDLVEEFDKILDEMEF